MTKSRVEAFSDGVLAIIITIMVLELRPPEGTQPADLLPLGPKFLAYVLSFANIGIYWNNHHHLFQAARTVSGRVLWANLHLLFWLSLIPFGTAWMGERAFASIPVAAYGLDLVLAAFAYLLLVPRADRRTRSDPFAGRCDRQRLQGQHLGPRLYRRDATRARGAARRLRALRGRRHHLDRPRSPHGAVARGLRSNACAAYACRTRSLANASH